MPQNTEEAILKRRADVARLYLEGKLQYEIAAIVNVSASQVSDDMEAVRQMWRDSAIYDLNEQKLDVLNQIDHLQATAYHHFMISSAPLRRNSKKLKMSLKKRPKTGETALINPKSEDNTPDEVEQYEYTEERLRDPRYLMIVADCIKQRRELLNLDEYPLKGMNGLLDKDGNPIKQEGPARNRWIIEDMSGGHAIPDPDSDYREQQ